MTFEELHRLSPWATSAVVTANDSSSSPANLRSDMTASGMAPSAAAASEGSAKGGLRPLVAALILSSALAACADSGVKGSADPVGAGENAASGTRDDGESRELDDIIRTAPAPDAPTPDAPTPDGLSSDGLPEVRGQSPGESSIPQGPDASGDAPGSSAPREDGAEQDPPASHTPAEAAYPAVALEKVLTLNAPIDMAAVPGDDHAWIAERAGRVLRVDLGEGEVSQVLLDISDETTIDGERGLLGIAVTADWLYASFTDLNGNSRVDAFARQGGGIGSRRRTILALEQPYSNHNGGALAFDDAGYLYIGFGDGGASGDPHGHGQNPRTWLGSMLRIKPTPEGVRSYSVPPDNPYASGGAGAPEVFLTGLRNPWRFSFDRSTGDLWIADVGQNQYEEVNVLRADPVGPEDADAATHPWAGADFGWNLREGRHPYSGGRPADASEDWIDPFWEYGRDDGCSVTGGFVYRGLAVDGLHGYYLFADYCTNRLWALDAHASPGSVAFQDLDADIPGGRIASFGQDTHGELYTLSLNGDIARIQPAGELSAQNP